MTSSRTLRMIAALLAASACSGATQGAVQTAAQQTTVSQGDLAAIAKARSDSARLPYVAADIHFMSGMISHHAQAITMSRWARTHGANDEVQRLADRIINAQTDEIALMQQWLRDRRQPVPDAKAGPMKMVMNGIEHEMLMPGMLSDEQMKQLDSARGTDFDRLFVSFMIQHHRGAVSMVKELFATYGAGQDEAVFKFASDVSVDQTTEIARMERMLAGIVLGIRIP